MPRTSKWHLCSKRQWPSRVLLNMEVFTWMIGNFQTSKSFNVWEREYRCLCSYYVINTYGSLMYELKKNWKGIYEWIFLGPGPSSYKKNYLPGRGLTKVGKHCSRGQKSTPHQAKKNPPWEINFKGTKLPAIQTRAAQCTLVVEHNIISPLHPLALYTGKPLCWNLSQHSQI
jgi:hypothetical protein